MKKTLLTIFAIVISLFAVEFQARPHFHPLRLDVGMQRTTESEINSLRLAGHTEMSFPRIRFPRPRIKIGLSHFAGMVLTRDDLDHLDQTIFNGGTGIKLFGRNMSYFRIGALRGRNGLDQKVKGYHTSLGIAPLNRQIGLEASYQKMDGENSVTVSVFIELYDFLSSRI